MTSRTLRFRAGVPLRRAAVLLTACWVMVVSAAPALAVPSDVVTQPVSENAQGDPTGSSIIWLVALVAGVVAATIGFLTARRNRR